MTHLGAQREARLIRMSGEVHGGHVEQGSRLAEVMMSATIYVCNFKADTCLIYTNVSCGFVTVNAGML